MSQENPSSQLDVEFIYLPVINYSMQQNRIPVVRLLSIKNRHKAQRKAKFYINKCRSASCMQSGWKQASA